MDARVSVISWVLLFVIVSGGQEFNHERHHLREEFGDEVLVKASGRTRGVVDLDDKAVVKRIMCKDLTIKVSLIDVKASKQWRPGDIVLGSSDLDCNLNSVHPDRPGIYTKMVTKKDMGNNRVDLTVETAKPLDIIEEAKISLHVKRDTEAFHTRHKRSASSQQTVSDFLTKPLRSIDWDKDVHTTVPFNPSRKVLSLRKMPGQKSPEISVQDHDKFEEFEDAEFQFTCYDCYGDTTIAFHLEMDIQKDANNQPNLRTYISQIEGRASGSYNFSIHSRKELTLSHSALLWETEPIRVDILPLSEFKRLPAILLEVNTSSAAYLSAYATTVLGNVSVYGNFDTDGNYAVSKEFLSSSSPPKQQATVFNWRTKLGSGNVIHSNTTYYFNVNVSQEIYVQPHIRWAKKDVHLHFSSPFKMRFDQGIVSSSTSTVSAIQNEERSNVTGYFDTSDNKVDVKAFGVNVWNVMLAKEQHQTETQITQHSLFSESKANCFGDPSGLDIGTCGELGTSIRRTSEEFGNLRKIFGDDLIQFINDENTTSTWCGEVGHPCPSCADFETDDVNTCADRLMTSSMAAAVTKLAKYVQAEWQDRKVVILDAWTEPTSQYLDGKFGNESLFNEGRAARVGVSKSQTLNPQAVEIETDPVISLRFKELLYCAGFPAASMVISDSVFEVCVSGKDGSVSYTKKRRRKKRATVTNNYAVSDNWLPEKEQLTRSLIDLPGHISMPSNVPDFLKTGVKFPPNKDADFMCGPSDEEFKRENKYQMKKLFQFPLDNVEFEAEGPSTSWCGTETRQCKQCTSYADSDDPMDWCESRIMNPRLIVRTYRLSKLVENEVLPSKRKKRSTSSSDKAISLPTGWTEKEYASCRNSPSDIYDVPKCEKELELSKNKCIQCLKERSCCLSKPLPKYQAIPCMQSECSTSGCSEKRSFYETPPSTSNTRCDEGDDWKMMLYDNVCSGDPCMFLNGAGYFVLLKILLLFEVCSPLINQKEMETWMADTGAAYRSDGRTLETFYKKCLKHQTADVLNLHREKYGDPTIGIGFSLKYKEQRDIFEYILPNVDLSEILNKTQKITEKEALFLFGIFTRAKLIGFYHVIAYDKFALLPVNVKIAIANAIYRGDFPKSNNPKSVTVKFKNAVMNNDWELAIATYKTHTNYKEIKTRFDFNIDQFRTMVKKTIIAGDKDKNRRRRSISLSEPDWFEKLRQAGRAVKIRMNDGFTLTTKHLANLAVEAGFDYVEINGNSIYTCVKAASGTTSQLMQYPKINLVGVDPPTEKIGEYLISPYADYALTYPLLVDGNNQDLKLSDCYQINDFKARNFRYFRLDPNLIECLDLASDYYGSCLKVAPDSGYRPHSLNNQNIDSRHEEEKWRFNVGMAVEVHPTKNTAENLEKMALTLMRSCTPGLRLKRMKLGMGVHSDSVYIDVRVSNDSEDVFELWNVGNNDLHKTIDEAYQQMMTGGPFIQPTNMKRACKVPALGEEHFYIKDPSKGICLFDFSGRFCDDTKVHRERLAEELAERLAEAAGSSQFPKATAKSKTEACLLETCGGCVSKGDKWEKKTRACLDLIQSFLHVSSTPFPMEKMKNHAAFFNTENPESHVHSLSCHDDSACIEDVQLHSILIKTVNEKYKPDPQKSNEELVFDPGNNPSPLLDLLEQEMAMKVSGNVTVYIEKDTDMSSFYHLIKILMVYNKNVGSVNFHLTKDVKEDRIIGSIQRKIERWAASSCPKRTRMLVAPYDIQIISESRRKRSIERSAERNQRISNMRNWELNWLMTMT